MAMFSTENVETIFMGTMLVGLLGSLIKMNVLPLVIVLISCISLYLYKKYYTHDLSVATKSSLELEKSVIQSARDNRRGQYATVCRQPQGKNKRTKQSFSSHI